MNKRIDETEEIATESAKPKSEKKSPPGEKPVDPKKDPDTNDANTKEDMNELNRIL